MGSLQTPQSDYAYCTLVTNDDYVLGKPTHNPEHIHLYGRLTTSHEAAAVLAESLRKTKTTLPICVLITPSTVSKPATSTLQSLFDLVIPVPALSSLTTSNLDLIGRPDLHATMTKIRLWSLTRFRRLLYLDADTLVVSSLDHLFALPRDIPFAAAPEIGFPDCFNSGVMLLRPDAATHAELTAFAARVDSFDGGDQGLLNVFFGDGTRNHPATLLLRNANGEEEKPPTKKSDAAAAAEERNWYRLSFTYNMEMHKVYRFYIPAALRYRDEHKVLHFIGKDKPWHFDEGRVDFGDDAGAYQRFYADMVGKWWDTRRSIQTAL